MKKTPQAAVFDFETIGNDFIASLCLLKAHLEDHHVHTSWQKEVAQIEEALAHYEEWLRLEDECPTDWDDIQENIRKSDSAYRAFWNVVAEHSRTWWC